MSRGHVDCLPLASRPDLESYSVDPLLWPTVAVTSLVTGAIRCESVQRFVKVARGPSLVRKAGGRRAVSIAEESQVARENAHRLLICYPPSISILEWR
jgi:hypothetical protein